MLQKYKGVRFFDEDEDQVYEIFANNLEWQKKIGKDPTTPCYVVMAKPINRDPNDESAAEDVPELATGSAYITATRLTEAKASSWKKNRVLSLADQRLPGALSQSE